MAVKLTKKQGINLEKGFDKLSFSVHWDTNADVDIHCLVLDDGFAPTDDDFVFYNNKRHPSKSIQHMGDIRSGEGSNGGNETIKVDLSKFPQDRNEILFTASIDGVNETGEHFGNIGRVICTLNDETNDKVLATYKVDSDLDMEVCGSLCRVIRKNDSFTFEAVGKSYNSLTELLGNYGLDTE